MTDKEAVERFKNRIIQSKITFNVQTFASKDIEAIQHVLDELEKKDQVISKMMDNIMTHYQVKTIRKMCCPICEIGERVCIYSGIHRNCIKQYFERKVESEEKQHE